MSCVCCALVIVTAVHSAQYLPHTVDSKPRSGDILYTRMQCSQAASTSFGPNHYLLLWWWLVGWEREDNNVRKWHCISVKWENTHRSLCKYIQRLYLHTFYPRNTSEFEMLLLFLYFSPTHYSPPPLSLYVFFQGTVHFLKALNPATAWTLIIRPPRDFNQGTNESQKMQLPSLVLPNGI